MKTLQIAILLLSINKGFAQDFYKDFVKYEDLQRKTIAHISKVKSHSINEQLANEYKKLFKEVKLKTGVYMLDRDTMYVFETKPDLYSGAYSKLFWNDHHSCYYDNQSFSPISTYTKRPIEIEVDGQNRLSTLPSELKIIIQAADTAAFKKYVQSNPLPKLGAVIRFMVFTKSDNHWRFFSSQSIALTRPD